MNESRNKLSADTGPSEVTADIEQVLFSLLQRVEACDRQLRAGVKRSSETGSDEHKT